MEANEKSKALTVGAHVVRIHYAIPHEDFPSYEFAPGDEAKIIRIFDRFVVVRNLRDGLIYESLRKNLVLALRQPK